MATFQSTYSFSRVLPVSVMVGLWILCIVGGCRNSSDPRLSEADSLIEDLPDSAMMILDGYRLGANSTAGDSAYYGMLLTHARYKNFIDETDDSLISASADFFLKHNDKEKAARSLFLKGMIQMNAQKFGDAAVSFSKGLDIAREQKSYMWEGQCARALFMLYGRLLNGSAQVKYAKEEYRAFSDGNCGDWVDYSLLDLATAYNNNGQYERSLTQSELLINRASEKGDSLLLGESLLLAGMTEFAMKNYDKCLEFYVKAYKLDPTILTEDNKMHISIAQSMVNPDALGPDFQDMVACNEMTQSLQPTFNQLADSGNYKDAYAALMEYKEKQEKFINKILDNNVSESVSSYQKTVSELNEERVRNEKLVVGIIIIAIIIVLVLIILFYRIRLYKSIASTVQTEAVIASLKADLLNQINQNKNLSETLDKQVVQLANINKLKENDMTDEDSVNTDNNISDVIGRKDEDNSIDNKFKNVLKEKYAEINELCDSYYQGLGHKEDRKEIERRVRQIATSFSKRKTLGDIEDYADSISENLYSSFKSDFINAGEDVRKLFLFLMLDFSILTICVLMNLERDVVYNRKARLKRKIKESDSHRRTEYLKYF